MKKKFKLQDLDCANTDNLIHNFIKTRIIGIYCHLLCHKADYCIVLMKLWMRLSVFVQKLSRIARFFCRR